MCPEWHEHAYLCRELAERVANCEAGERVSAPAVYEQIELFDFPNFPEMLSEDRQDIIANLNLLINSVSGGVADNR